MALTNAFLGKEKASRNYLTRLEETINTVLTSGEVSPNSQRELSDAVKTGKNFLKYSECIGQEYLCQDTNYRDTVIAIAVANYLRESHRGGSSKCRIKAVQVAEEKAMKLLARLASPEYKPDLIVESRASGVSSYIQGDSLVKQHELSGSEGIPADGLLYFLVKAVDELTVNQVISSGNENKNRSYICSALSTIEEFLPRMGEYALVQSLGILLTGNMMLGHKDEVSRFFRQLREYSAPRSENYIYKNFFYHIFPEPTYLKRRISKIINEGIFLEPGKGLIRLTGEGVANKTIRESLYAAFLGRYSEVSGEHQKAKAYYELANIVLEAINKGLGDGNSAIDALSWKYSRSLACIQALVTQGLQHPKLKSGDISTERTGIGGTNSLDSQINELTIVPPDNNPNYVPKEMGSGSSIINDTLAEESAEPTSKLDVEGGNETTATITLAQPVVSPESEFEVCGRGGSTKKIRGYGD